MPFCPTCKSEFREGFARCEECDVELVATLPSPPPRLETPIPCRRSVYYTTELADALLVESFLVDNGLRADVENQHSPLLTLGLPTAAIPFVVSVPATEELDAAEIVKELVKSRPAAILSRRFPKRLWLFGIAVLIPILADDVFGHHPPFIGYEPILAMGAWSALVLALILDIRTRVRDVAFSESRILVFWISGAFGPIVVAALDAALTAVGGNSIRGQLFQFLFVGPVEETAKFLPALAFFWIRPAWFKDPVAWVVAGASSGAGFGMTETLFKFQSHSHDAFNAFVIAVSGLLHPLLAGLVGYCVSKAGRIWMPAAVGGLALAALLHGLWNVAAYSELSWACPWVMLFVVWFYLRNFGRIFPEAEEAPKPVETV